MTTLTKIRHHSLAIAITLVSLTLFIWVCYLAYEVKIATRGIQYHRVMEHTPPFTNSIFVLPLTNEF